MKKHFRIGILCVFVLLLGVIIVPETVKASTGSWGYSSNGIVYYTAGSLAVGSSAIPGSIPNSYGEVGIRQNNGLDWLSLEQSQYNSHYFFHDSSDGSALELAAQDGTNGAMHWQIMRIIRNGDVLFGGPSYPVAVKINGVLTAKQVIVTTAGTWPDYVFDSNYQLPSLESVDSYVQENKHLPNVPTEDEIAQNGISIGDMQQTQMQKIEELTLYDIQLNKDNEQLKTQVSQLSDEVEQIQSMIQK